MRYRVKHITHYKYGNKVNACYNRAHLLPRETLFQTVTTPQVMIHPIPSTGNRRVDYFGNRAYHFSITEPHKSLIIDVTTTISYNHVRPNLTDQLDYGSTCAEVLASINQPGANVETLYAREFLLKSPMISPMAELAEFASDCFAPNKSYLTAVKDLNTKIFTEFEFDSGSTNVATPIEEVIQKRSGVCQDFAHLAIGCMRSLGYPARYISGYLETLPPPGEKKLEGVDASHAWFSVFSPGEGWFEFDPTNNTTPQNQHLVTAWGRDYSDVSPLRGVISGGGSSQNLSVSVDVKRLD